MKLLIDHHGAQARIGSAVLALLLLATPCQIAFAAPPAAKSKVVQALIAGAQKEFEAGNFDRAGEMFFEIWQQDPDSRPALYNAARAYQLGGKIERADELFHMLLAIPDLDPVLKTKSQAQLEAVQQKRGERKADEADRAEKAGQYGAAAGLWGEATRLLPAKSQWLLRHARALHLAGQGPQALAAYDQYLAATPESSPDRAQVRAWREDLRQKPAEPLQKPVEPSVRIAPVATRPTPGALPVKSVIVSEPAPAPVVPLAVLGGSGALLIGGVVVLALASGDDADLQAKFVTDKKISANVITHAAAVAEAERISGNYKLGWALTGIGLVGAGVGTWLLLRKPSAKVAIAPSVGGAVVTARF